MLNSLRVRIFLMMALVVAAAVGTVAAFASQGTNTAVKDFVISSAERDQRIVGVALAAGPVTDPQAVQQHAQALEQAVGAQILLVDGHGMVLLDSANQRVGEVISLPPPAFGVPDETIASTIQFKNEPAYVFLDYSPVGLSPNATFNAPITRRWLVDAPPDVQLVGSPAQDVVGSINRSLLLAIAAGGGVAVALTLGLSRGIVGPVEALTAAARRLEKGDLSQRVRVGTHDEIGTLAHAFNAMADGLARTEQLRRSMVGDIAHELRTPLTNLRGYLEALKDGVLEPKPEMIASLYEESLLLHRLVEDLQELALAEAGQLKLVRQPVAVADLVAKTLAALPPQLTTSGPPVQVEVPDDLPPVDADAERLRQVLRNLLTNAFHHTPPEGSITVRARPAEGAVELSVSDTGSGIAPEHLPNVFERFYRADASRARTTGGAGLGLAIVKQLVEAHGGQVRAESVLGDGTTFTVTLPIATLPYPGGKSHREDATP